MSSSVIQIAGFTLLSALFIVIIYFLARRSLLSFRYAMGWLLLFVPGMFAAWCIPVLNPISRSLGVSPIAVIAIFFITVLLMICIQLSISISGLQEHVRTLSEEVAQIQLNSEGPK